MKSKDSKKRQKQMICKRCLLTNDLQNVHLNKEGVCNFCISYFKNKRKLADYPKLERDFRNRIEKHKKNRALSNYDCIIPFSGGKDSSYILYTMKKKYKLKVLAITCENWFSSKQAKGNVKNLCKKLNVDQIYYKLGWDTVKKVYAVLFKKRGLICFGCMAIIWVNIFKIAIEKKIKAIVIGESRDQLLSGRIFSDIGTIKNGYDEIDNYRKKGFFWSNVYKQLFKEVNLFTRKYFANDIEVKENFMFPLDSVKEEDIPDIIPYFLFAPYDERRIKRELQEKVGWKDIKIASLASHTDCLFYPLKDNPAEKAKYMSVFIREGVMTRKEALQEYLRGLKYFTYNDYDVQLKKILKKINLNVEDIKGKDWYRYRKMAV